MSNNKIPTLKIPVNYEDELIEPNTDQWYGVIKLQDFGNTAPRPTCNTERDQRYRRQYKESFQNQPQAPYSQTCTRRTKV